MVQLARNVWKNWAILFTAGVVIWFGVSALDIAKHVPEWPLSAGTKASEIANISAPAKTTAAPTRIVNPGALQFKVKALRVHSDDKSSSGYGADVTLEVSNNDSRNVDFSPQRLTLQSPDGSSTTATTSGPANLTISPHLAQLSPMTFPLAKPQFGTYKLFYGDRVIYSGLPA